MGGRLPTDNLGKRTNFVIFHLLRGRKVFANRTYVVKRRLTTLAAVDQGCYRRLRQIRSV